MRRLVTAAVAASMLVTLLGATARAQAPVGEVRLHVTRASIVFGEKTKLWGRIEPAAADQPVEIIDQNERVRATVMTDEEGRFSLEMHPRNNLTLRARWAAVTSDRVWVRVRAIVDSAMGGVRLFDRVGVRGSVRPAHPGGRAEVVLMNNGKPVARRSTKLRDGMWIKTGFAVRKPGSYRVRVSFDDDDHLGDSSWTDPRSTPLPSLGAGSRGRYVKLLERRLRKLNYYIPYTDRIFDEKTGDALRAFNKVQGRARLGSVDAATWQALSSPKIPRPRAKGPRFHFEVDQTKQVLYTVFRGKVTNILHVSTGAGNATRDGVFHVFRKLTGYSPNRLYYPSYWDGLRAFHGWPEVPTYNASHGCVRVPMWAAQWLYNKAPIGSEVRIYH